MESLKRLDGNEQYDGSALWFCVTALDGNEQYDGSALVLLDGIGFVLQVTVMHSMQAGYLEKAQKYTDKALMQLEKLKSTIF